MIVYNSTKEQFCRDAELNQIADVVYEKLKGKHLTGGQDAEYHSWMYSLKFMETIMRDEEIPNDVQVAIEYQIPRTSKRVDFMIAGADKSARDNVVVIELKQWETAQKVDDIRQHSVRAFTGGANRIVNHPAYQAYAYATFIRNSSEQVQDDDIGIQPCAYLHNCSAENRKPLDDGIYSTWLEEAPLFDKGQVMELRGFIKKFVTAKSSSGDLLYKIDNGRIRPSKALQDCLVSLMKGNEEFVLLDDQAVAFDVCRKFMKKCTQDFQKRTVIIRGGAGTGKSVLAVNLLNEFVQKGLNAAYCTKNAAPKDAFLKLLAKSDLKAQVNIKQLFRSPFGLNQAPKNSYDCLLVDEAHRLVKKMFMDKGAENQVKECINASLLTVFFLDEDQQVTTKDIGSAAEIKKWAEILGSEIPEEGELALQSQFRCNGSDQYIQLINNILQIGESVDVDLSEMNYDIRVFDDPNELRDSLREINKKTNKARMVAGYCYDWDVKNHRGDFDIYLKNGFKAQWNLPGEKVWAINPKSFEQVGCIHTAQGLEFDYVGVLIGKDLRYDSESGHIITDRTQVSKDDNSSGIKSAPDDVAARLIKNTYKTLLTRGQKGCFIYCEDEALAERIKKMTP